MKRYGEVLVLKEEGEEAFYSADEIFFHALKQEEVITLDFNKVRALSPFWIDEFICDVKKKYTNKLEFINIENETVKLALKIALS